jgi:hypothetical protein
VGRLKRQQHIIHNRVRNERVFSSITENMKEVMINIVEFYTLEIKNKIDKFWEDVRRDIQPPASIAKKSGNFELKVIKLAETVHQLKSTHKSIVEAAQKLELKLANKKNGSE